MLMTNRSSFKLMEALLQSTKSCRSRISTSFYFMASL